MRPPALLIRGIRRVDDQARRHYAVPSHRLLQVSPPNRSRLARLRVSQSSIWGLFEGHAEKNRTSRWVAPVLRTKHMHHPSPR